jgi:hypothetical protein
MTAETVVVAYVPDLMDRSKVSAALPGTTFVARPGALAEAAATADLVLLDLSRPGVMDVLPLPGTPRVVGFASHVDTDTLDAAAAAGVEVMPRSAFFRRVGEFVAGF